MRVCIIVVCIAPCNLTKSGSPKSSFTSMLQDNVLQMHMHNTCVLAGDAGPARMVSSKGCNMYARVQTCVHVRV
jgi:hypothetical protein